MEEKSQRKANEMEDLKGRCGVSQSLMDVYIRDPDVHEEIVRPEKQNDTGHIGGAGGGEGHKTGEGQQRILQVGELTIRCNLLDHRDGQYSCFNCPGGRNYDECQRIRGIKK